MEKFMRKKQASWKRPLTLFLTFLFCLIVTLEAIQLRASAFSDDWRSGLDIPPFISLIPLAPRETKTTITLDHVWVTDIDHQEKTVFSPGEKILLSGAGTNAGKQAVSSLLTWNIESSCDLTVIYSDTFSLDAGSWTQIYSSTLSDCLGIYTFTLTVDKALTPTLSTNFSTTIPSTVIISDQQAFDKCEVPTIEQMQTWWENSPYTAINLYMGGISRSSDCNNELLDTEWVNAVSQQGWLFIPTWVGPQSPCSSFKHVMSSDPNITYLEGRAEADAAVAAADSLGFYADKVIYYDLEGFSGASQECRDATKSFVRGWTERIHELGFKAGMYGGACSSYIVDWTTIDPVPDDIWIASWYTNKYDPDATVWDVPCVTTSLWADHQRIRQYAGGHKETWNGLRMTIDSNAVDGEVVWLPVSTTLTSTQSGYSSVIVDNQSTRIHDIQFLSPNEGWVLTDRALLWTQNLGKSWKNIAPVELGDDHILGVYFVTSDIGWLIANEYENDHLGLYHTSDGGNLWVRSDWADSASEIGAASLFFLDSQTGWLSVILRTSQNFSLGRLYGTTDGGLSWNEYTLPVGGEVYFTDAKKGFLVGGFEGKDLYRTNDGGRTWSIEESGSIIDDDITLRTINTSGLQNPIIKAAFLDPQTGWVLMEDNSCEGYKLHPGEFVPAGEYGFTCTRQDLLWLTMDGGLTWIDITPKVIGQ
jgi:hypothetical protein